MNQTNVDPSELQKFESIAEKWWDRNSEFKPLHEINPLRVNFIDERCPIAGKKAIDVGCGGGILSEALTQRGAQVTGIDMAEGPLAVAKIHANKVNLNIEYLHSNAEEMATERQEQYDIVCCLEMLEHVPQPESVIDACTKLAKPGGHIFLSTINRNPKSYLMAIIGAEYVLQLLPKGTHDYEKLIKPSELSRAARNSGLLINEIVGMGYNPLTKVYKLTDNVDVNYLVHLTKPQSK